MYDLRVDFLKPVLMEVIAPDKERSSLKNGMTSRIEAKSEMESAR